MSDYTPTENVVREVWIEAQDITHDMGADYHGAEFDRMLAARDATVRAEERERIAQVIKAERENVPAHVLTTKGQRAAWKIGIARAFTIVRKGA